MATALHSILHIMVLLRGSYVHGQEILPPVLNTTEEVILIKTDQLTEDLIIACMGQQPLKWHTPQCHPPCCHEMNDNDVDIINGISNVTYPFASILKVRNHRGNHTGLYSCMYKDSTDNNPEMKASTYVYFHRPDKGVKLVNHVKDVVDVAVGSTLILDCRLSHPNDTVPLEFNYEKVDFSSDERIKFDPQKGFIINNVTKRDDGEYRCSTNKDIIVNVKDEIPLLPRAEVEIPANQHFVVGEDITLICKSSDWHFPSLQARWTTPRKSIRYRTSSSSKDRSVLTIDKATMEDSGTYACSIYNYKSCKISDYTETSTISIQVQEEKAVVFVDGSIGWKQIVEVRQNNDYWISCSVIGHPRPNIFWYKDDVLINKTDLEKIGHPNEENPHQLELINIGKINEGTYKCVANNTKNEIHRSVTLKYVDGIGIFWTVAIVILVIGTVTGLVLIGVFARNRLKQLSSGESPVEHQDPFVPDNGNAADPLISPSTKTPVDDLQPIAPELSFQDRLNTLKYQHAVVKSGQKLLHLIMRTLICGDINNINGCLRESLGSNTQYNNSFTKDEQQILETVDHKKWDVSLLFKIIQKVCGLNPAGDNCWTQNTGGDESLEYLITTLKNWRNELVHNFDLILNEDQLADRLEELRVLALKMKSTLGERARKQGKQLSVKESDETIKLVLGIIEDVKEKANESTPAATQVAVNETVESEDDSDEDYYLSQDAVPESVESQSDSNEDVCLQYDNVYVAAGVEGQASQQLSMEQVVLLTMKFWKYAGPKDV